MEDPNLSLLLKYPLITRRATGFGGLVTISGKDRKIRISEDGEGQFRVATTFGGRVDPVLSRLRAGNIVEFLESVRATLDSYSGPGVAHLVTVYSRVLDEYTEFTQFHMNVKASSLSPDFSTIRVSTSDERGREHRLQIGVDFAEECHDIFKVTRCDFPRQSCHDLVKKSPNLTGLYDTFLATMEMLQDFFDSMDSIDRACRVIDPETPTRSDCHRRIGLGNNVSLVVTVDPHNVNGTRPDLKFLGPDFAVDDLVARVNDNLEEWDPSDGVVDGLLKILGLDKFPTVTDGSSGDCLVRVGECCICFSLRLDDGRLPEVICGNRSCGFCYHTGCLYQWLSSLNPNKIFNQIQGQCPNCEKAISCPYSP